MSVRSSRSRVEVLSSCAAVAVMLVVAASATTLNAQAATWPQHSLERPKPPVEVAPPQQLPVAAPAGAIVLFNGGDLSWWQSRDGEAAKWRVVDGAFEVVPRRWRDQDACGFR